MKPRPPPVYSRSGCSSAARRANALALRLDREGIAGMSCIAGAGVSGVGRVRTARAGRPIPALDGCALRRVAACLARKRLTATRHVLLADHGVRRKAHADFDAAGADAVHAAHVRPAAVALAEAAAHAG